MVQLGQQIAFDEQWWVPQVMLSVWMGPAGAVWEGGVAIQAAAAAISIRRPTAPQVFNIRHLLSQTFG